MALKASEKCVRDLNNYGLEYFSETEQWLLMDVAAMVKVNIELTITMDGLGSWVINKRLTLHSRTEL